MKNLLPIGASLCVGLWLVSYKIQPTSASFDDTSNYSIELKDEEILRQDIQEDLGKAIIDTPPPVYKPSRFPRYYPKPRYSDPLSNPANRSRLFYPSPTNTQILFSPDSSGYRYIYSEKLGNYDFRYPTYLTQDEQKNLELNSNIEDFWLKQTQNENAETETQSTLIPKIPAKGKVFGRIFGGDAIEFKPTGFVNLDFAMQFQRVANPALPIRQQRNTNFLFDPHANINLIGKVGDKLEVSGNFDTKASFQFENNFKVEYKGYEEDIIQKVEFGNVAFPLPTTLIQGSNSLFGIATQLRFGRLDVRSVFSNQRARIQTVTLEGGAQRRNFEIAAGDYEDNRHFFLAQFFRNNYERSLQTLPVVTSGVQITRIEVYTTNRTGNTQTLRNVAAFLDAGEANPFNTTDITGTSQAQASNEVNNLFTQVDNVRDADNASTQLEALGFTRGEDFEILRAARQLTDREFTYNRELGYISLLTPLRNDEILAVAFEYTLNGRTFKVGELTEDYVNRPSDEVIHLKMLRPSSIRLDLPTWDLMMKNVYALNASQIQPNNFQLRVVYRDDITGIDNPTLQEGQRLRDVPLLRVVGLDRLNQRQDPQRDGNFDYVEGITIDSQSGRIYFPVLEPFGSNLVGGDNFLSNPNQLKFNPVSETDLINKYVFTQLYESTKADALQAADKNKFFIVGSFEGSAGASTNLPAINIAPGSVVVTAGGIPLVEGEQYTVDYNTGQVTIIDESIKNSGQTIEIDFEQADLFNAVQRRFTGTRFDYHLNRDFTIGSTFINLNERPIITRVNVGEEPINNTMLGLDVNYRSTSRLLTKIVDKIPLIDTKAESSVDFYAEYAQLFPGASRISGEVSLIDDFEGTRTTFNLTRAPQISWRLGSTPQLFPEASSQGLEYGFHRAKVAWYNIDNLFYRDGSNIKPDNISDDDLENHYIRVVQPQEVFRNREPLQIQVNELIFDVAYYPNQRGPYNYNPDLNRDGTLKNPRQNFGSLTRAITQDIDFDNANVEYIEFWLMNPFIEGERGRVLDGELNQNNTTGGEIYINIGNISEDLIPDGRHAFENGLPADGNTALVTENNWGRVTNQQFLNNAFDNTAGARENQDIGLDGLSSTEELTFPSFQAFVSAVNTVVTDPDARAEILADVSADDFQYYLDGSFDDNDVQILERYQDFNGYENNSPESSATGAFTPSATNLPDNEDLNNDNTITDLEGYYQYRIPLRPSDLVVGQGYIIDQITNTINGDDVTWYQFRIPVREFDDKVGSIEGFKSIRFVRFFMTEFQQPAVLRFAQFQFVASQWRRFIGDLSDRTFGLPSEPYDANFTVATVNIEENGAFEEGDNNIPYTLPPGVVRDIDVTNINNRRLNEQSMLLSVEQLRDRDARAVFKNYNLDLLSYKRLRMYIHAESQDAQDGEVTAFVRLGTDFTDNYYEVEVPLTMTPPGTPNTAPEIIWPVENEIDIPFKSLTNTKVNRNRSGQNIVIPFKEIVGRYRITVVGNPDLSTVQTAMIGIRNPNQEEFGVPDDRLAKSVTIWVNELRISDFDQTAGWAALARTNVRLADFAQVSSSLSYTTFGFGAINQRISERARERTITFDISANVALDKFIPEKLGLKVPFYISYERRNVSPRFNPLDPDVELQESLDALETEEDRRRLRSIVEENMTRRSINFSNVRKIRTNPDAKIDFFDIENLAFTWAFTEEERSDIFTADYLSRNQRYALNYTFSKQANFIKPFEKSKRFGSPYLQLLKDFNFSLLPNAVNISFDLNRRFTRTVYRGADLTTIGVEPLYEKIFTFDRAYTVGWQFTENLSLNYNAIANTVVDEPDGELDTEEKRDSVWNNLLNFGRMKNFTQSFDFRYKVPLDKIPFTAWVTADAGYNVGYTWQAGAIGIADTLGNTMSNNKDQSLNTSFNLDQLYKRVKFLQFLDSKPKRRKTKKLPNNAKDSSKKKENKKIKDTKVFQTLMRAIFSVKKINLTYTINEQTVLPGFLPIPRLFGLDSSFAAPGYEFVLGSQDPDIRTRARSEGWISQSPFLNNPFMQAKRENLTLRANIEPLKDFKITLDAKKTWQTNYQEFFRFDTTSNQVVSQSPLRTGNYSISFISIQTAFQSDDGNNVSAAFSQFADNRAVIQSRLNALSTSAGEFGLNSQDVLIPAFLAAYAGRDAATIDLSPFPKTPLPNWQIDYNGLSKISFLKNIFSSVTLNHSYASSYGVNNFTSSLQYGADVVNPEQTRPDFILPTLTNDQNEFIPAYVINQVVISEKFSPLIGMNVRTKSNLTVRLDYTRERDLSLNISNAQIAEMRSQGITFGLGFAKKGVKLPFKSRGKTIVLKNDLDMRLDVTIRDTRTIQRQLDGENIVTAGNLNYQIRPVISYIVNKQLSLNVYFERSVNTPRVSSSFPRRNTTAGIQLRYNIIQ